MAKSKPTDDATDAPAGATDAAPPTEPPKADPKQAAALARIKAAIADKPAANAMVQIGEDTQGNPRYGERKPLATVLAADVLAVATAVPADRRTQVVKDLRLGVANVADVLKGAGRDLAADFAVQQQCQDLAELVRVYDETRAA